MIYYKIRILLLCCFSTTSMLFAQESVNASGGSVMGSNGSVTYSVGQLVYTVQNGSNGSSAQGVQQSFEISMTLGIEETNIQLQAIAFPNPTTSYINLHVEETNLTDLRYQLIDISGRLLNSQKISKADMKVPMHQLPSATYFISVFRNNAIVKTFKIIKK